MVGKAAWWRWCPPGPGPGAERGTTARLEEWKQCVEWNHSSTQYHRELGYEGMTEQREEQRVGIAMVVTTSMLKRELSG